MKSDTDNKKKHLIYIGDWLGTPDTAMMLHASNLARIFNTLGYEVIFISQRGWKPGMKSEIVENDFHCFYSENKAIPNDRIRYYYRRWNELTGMNHWRRIKEVFEKYPPSLIVCYGYVCSRQLVRYYERTRIPLVFDNTDWVDKSHYTGFYRRYIWTRVINKSMVKWRKRAAGIICISKYFYDYYKLFLPVIYVPALCSIDENINITRDNTTEIRLVYAGMPGNKDIIAPVVEAVSEINKEEKRIRLDLIGVEPAMMNHSNVFFHGRLPHDKTIEIVKKADFSLLLRNNDRCAKAGFSTKFVESMWLGVPVICTKIGGTDTCVSDMHNGILLSDNSKDEIKRKLNELMAMETEDIYEMKMNAYRYARTEFCVSKYVSPMKNFISNLDR